LWQSDGVRRPWYLVPRSMGGWQLRLSAAVAPLLACGLGFVVGWSLVRYPGRGDYSSMPAPGWLLWTGVGCGVVAVAAFAVARLMSPPYESNPDVPSPRPKPVRRVRAVDVVALLSLVGSLFACSIVSSSSDYRWRPAWAIAILTIIGLPLALMTSREHVR
jgi:hypothetical protein